MRDPGVVIPAHADQLPAVSSVSLDQRYRELPATKQTPAGRTSPDRGAKAGRGSETVMLMGDDLAVQGFIGDVLRRRGYCLLMTQDAWDARRWAHYPPASPDRSEPIRPSYAFRGADPS